MTEPAIFRLASGMPPPAELFAKGGAFITVHPDDYRPTDPDDPHSPHDWQPGDRFTAYPFTVGEIQETPR